MTTTKPLHDDISIDRAWRAGRRIYVRCGYGSQLNTELREIGAKWDAEVRALWVGSGKADKVIPLVQAHGARVDAIATVKADATTHLRWVEIPYSEQAIRDHAKALGGVWDAERKLWAMPTDETAAEVRALVAQHEQDVQAAREQARAERAAEIATDRAQDAARAEQALAASIAEILSRAGRTGTGETVAHVEVSTQRMNRATAETQARRPGSLVRLRDGRRGIVVAVKTWFTGEEFASSTCWHLETHDTAHWDFRYTLAIVEPTADETAADRAVAAQHAEQAEIDAVFDAVARQGEWTDAHAQDRWTAVAGPVITRTASGARDDGRLVLDGDRLLWQHPGYYDDYRRSERASTDPGLIARFRDLVAAGPRRVGAYRIEVPE